MKSSAAYVCRDYFAKHYVRLDHITPGQKELGWFLVESPLVTTKSRPSKKWPKVIKAEIASGVYFFLIDGHHRMARQWLQKGALAYTPFDLLRTDRLLNMTDLEYFERLKENGEIYPGKTLYKDVNTTWSFERDWPKNFSDLKNSSLRSMIKMIFSHHKLKSSYFVDYFQLILKDKISERWPYRKWEESSKRDLDFLEEQLWLHYSDIIIGLGKPEWRSHIEIVLKSLNDEIVK